MTMCPSYFEPREHGDWDAFCDARYEADEARIAFAKGLAFTASLKPTAFNRACVAVLLNLAQAWRDAESKAREFKEGVWWGNDPGELVADEGADWWVDCLSDEVNPVTIADLVDLAMWEIALLPDLHHSQADLEAAE